MYLLTFPSNFSCFLNRLNKILNRPHALVVLQGINLSGGQKQRICIARAMYSHADVLILDDPLSALDPHVGAHIFDDGIIKFALKRKRTVILVTHQLQYLGYANSVSLYFES